MPYITTNLEPRIHQLTIDDILSGCDESLFLPKKNTRDTRTWFVPRVKSSLIEKTDFAGMHAALTGFVNTYRHLIETEDKSKLYYSFKIPKRSGGLRKIDAPNDELKQALRELKHILEGKFFASYHSSAFAYIRGRSTLDSVKRHQSNNSRWFLKLDFSKFFPSTNQNFLLSMLYQTYPISEYISLNSFTRSTFEKAISLCFLDGGLPQGTPTSPILTNMMMIPIDHAISKMCREHSPHLLYTRYADDMLISSQYSFQWTDVVNSISGILKEFHAPFRLNGEKTRYGSSAGRNWNLGVMLNKDNQITVGHEKKKVFKAMLYQFMVDDARGFTWDVEDVQHLLGLAAYYRSVEGETIDAIFQSYSRKFKKDVMATAKAVLHPVA